MSRENEYCIYCNRRKSSPKGDHIPPKGFFAKKSNLELVQVPCCITCNNAWSKLDQRLRNFMVSLEDNENHPIVKGELYNTISRDLNDPKKGDGRTKRFVNDFVDMETVKRNVGKKQLIPPDKITDCELNRFDMPLVLRYEERQFFLRMAKALLFEDLTIRIKGNLKFRIVFPKELPFREFILLERLKVKTIMKDVAHGAFKWITFINDSKGTVICWMQFYEGFEVVVILPYVKQ